MGNNPPFPTRKEDFQSDDRVNFYPEDGKWILEDGNGEEWEWVEETGRWVPAMREEEVAAQQQAYASGGVEDNGTTAEEEFKNKKRKLQAELKQDPTLKKQKTEKQNSAVYVTSIPLDATIDEVHEVFRKYGIVAEEIDSDKPRIKMYTDSEGNFKGDALVVYFKPESVALAIQMLDDSEFRWGAKGPDGPMRVKVADTSYKKTKLESANGSGTSTPAAAAELGQAPKRGRKGDKQKIIEKTQRLNQRLADWSDDEDGGAILNPEVKKEVKKASKHDKVIVLKHMFTPAGLKAELADDPEAKDWLLEDVKEECEKVSEGTVLEVACWDEEEEGIITVKFAEAEEAEMAIKKLDGRTFGEAKCVAYLWKGEKFKKAEIDEEEERRRLDAFAERLETMPDD